VFVLKGLTSEAVPAALEKALRYRMLNEPEQAESICQDVLRADPDNQDALAMLILALTDRFGGLRPVQPQSVLHLVPRLKGAYEREYYAGIVWSATPSRGCVPCPARRPGGLRLFPQGHGLLRAGRGAAAAR